MQYIHKYCISTLSLIQSLGGESTEVVPSDPGGGGVLTARNLQDMLNKLTVSEANKPHEFWDTQPVPKLGKE